MAPEKTATGEQLNRWPAYASSFFFFSLDILPLSLDHPMIRSPYTPLSIHHCLVSHVSLAEVLFLKLSWRISCELMIHVGSAGWRGFWFASHLRQTLSFRSFVWVVARVGGRWVVRTIHITHPNCCDRPKLDINSWCNRKIHNPRLISHQPRATE